MAFQLEGNNNIADLIARLGRVRAQIGPMVQLGMEQLAEKAVTELQAAAPFDPTYNIGVIPGEEAHLNESFSVGNSDATESEAMVQVKTSEPIKFQYVTQGTDGPIEPVTASALRIPGWQHPVAYVSGQAANPFQEGVMQSLQGENPFQPVIDMIQGELG